MIINNIFSSKKCLKFVFTRILNQIGADVHNRGEMSGTDGGQMSVAVWHVPPR